MTITQRAGVLALFLSSLCGLLAGCSEAPPTRLRVATSPWLGYEPLFLARDKAFFDARRVELLEFVTPAQVTRSLLEGNVDAAAVTLDEALRIIAKTPRFHLALVFDYCEGADVLIAKPGVHSIAALKGRRIGLDDSALSAHVLRRALDQAGLSIADVELSILLPDDQIAAFRSGTVDALVAYDPALTRLKSAGGTVLFDTTRIPAEVSDVLLVRNDLPAAHRAALDELRQGWYRSVAFVAQERVAAAAAMAPRLQLTSSEMLAAIEKTRFLDAAENAALLDGPIPAYGAVADRVKTTLVAMRLLTAADDISPLLDARARRATAD